LRLAHQRVVTNTLVKTGMAVSIGSAGLRRTIIPTTGILLAAAAIGVMIGSQVGS